MAEPRLVLSMATRSFVDIKATELSISPAASSGNIKDLPAGWGGALEGSPDPRRSSLVVKGTSSSTEEAASSWGSNGGGTGPVVSTAARLAPRERRAASGLAGSRRWTASRKPSTVALSSTRRARTAARRSSRPAASASRQSRTVSSWASAASQSETMGWTWRATADDAGPRLSSKSGSAASRRRWRSARCSCRTALPTAASDDEGLPWARRKRVRAKGVDGVDVLERAAAAHGGRLGELPQDWMPSVWMPRIYRRRRQSPDVPRTASRKQQNQRLGRDCDGRSRDGQDGRRCLCWRYETRGTEYKQASHGHAVSAR